MGEREPCPKLSEAIIYNHSNHPPCPVTAIIEWNRRFHKVPDMYQTEKVLIIAQYDTLPVSFIKSLSFHTEFKSFPLTIL